MAEFTPPIPATILSGDGDEDYDEEGVQLRTSPVLFSRLCAALGVGMIRGTVSTHGEFVVIIDAHHGLHTLRTVADAQAAHHAIFRQLLETAAPASSRVMATAVVKTVVAGNARVAAAAVAALAAGKAFVTRIALRHVRALQCSTRNHTVAFADGHANVALLQADGVLVLAEPAGVILAGLPAVMGAALHASMVLYESEIPVPILAPPCTLWCVLVVLALLVNPSLPPLAVIAIVRERQRWYLRLLARFCREMGRMSG